MQHTGVTGSPAVTSPGQTSQQQQFHLSGPQQLTHPGAEAARPLTVPVPVPVCSPRAEQGGFYTAVHPW